MTCETDMYNVKCDVAVIGEYAFRGASVTAFTIDKDNKTFYPVSKYFSETEQLSFDLFSDEE